MFDIKDAVRIVKVVGALVAALTITPVFLHAIGVAKDSVGLRDASEIASVQQSALALGGYAPSIPELIADSKQVNSVTGAAQSTLAVPPGKEVMTLANASRTQYIAGSKLSNGEIVLLGSEHLQPVTCTVVGPKCFSALTSDPTLINATPLWVKG